MLVCCCSCCGLSPRLRGNPLHHYPESESLGSIPAPAGEPQRPCEDWYSPAVYPRACGGTQPETMTLGDTTGLSPRLRGNRHLHHQRRLYKRSIPAPAGEPRPNSRIVYPPRVYPRACGGTNRRVRGVSARMGLSPRLRGNLLVPATPPIVTGSIPAPAGEPFSLDRPARNSTVYPRACGGTVSCEALVKGADGLSPRLRGNLSGRGRPRIARGSIPAPAGEP